MKTTMKFLRISVLLVFLPGFLIGQNESKYDVSISGFISSESIFDTRQTVSAREGDVLLFPSPVNEDANGADLNGQSSFNMFAIHSRVRTRVAGPEMLGAQSSALIETDFVGNSNSVMSMMRLRHAILKLEWEKTSIMAGQYWHPMFVASCYPEVAAWGGGIPFAILSRNPQIRFGFELSEKFSGSLIALTQRDFSSPGPAGTSPDYLRNSGLPEYDVHLEYHNSGWKIGMVAGYKEILPRKQDLQGLKLEETLGSWQGNAYIRKDWSNLTAKVQGLYGQNMYNFLMMGGYAEFINNQTNSITYSNNETASIWTEWLYEKGRMTYSVFGGYSKNMGLSQKPEEGIEVNRYGRGNNIDYTYRIAPRITLKVEKFLIMGEVSYNAAAYGTIESDGEVVNTETADNVRAQMHLKYNF